jgi:predicted flap endonuclease-1-like 5' DNA nuclease
MNTAAVFVLGLLIGWLIEWIIDWLYWRRLRAESAEPVARARTRRLARYKEPPANPDDLTVIRGIGTVIAKRLNQVGIFTFEQLAELTPDEFETALDDLLQHFFDERSILRQADELARKKKDGQLK